MPTDDTLTGSDLEGVSLRIAMHARIADLLAERDRLRETLLDVLYQSCWDEREQCLDSGALSAYANGLRLMASDGFLTITQEHGRRVIAKAAS